MTDTPTLYDPNTIPIGGPGQPLSNGHLAAHSQIRAEIVVNANDIAGLTTAVARLPQGLVAGAYGPASTVSCSTATTIMSLAATVVAGRRYRLSVFAWGAQAGSVGTAFFGLSSTANIDSAQGRLAQITGLAVGSFLVGTAVWTYTPTAASSQTWTLQGTTSAGSLTVSANQCSMLLET